jgi:gluconolactonase
MRLDQAGKRSVYRSGAGTNGLLFDDKGRLLACEPVRRRVTRTDADGEVRVLAERYEGMRFNQPNDITVDSRGRIYFSDPKYGPRENMEMLDAEGKRVEGVYRIDLDGKVTRVITHEADRPNGLVVTPDDRYLYVADNNNNDLGGARKLWRFNLQKDGDVDHSSRKLIYDWGSSRGPDGMVLDREGRLYVAGGLNTSRAPVETNDKKGGVYVFSPEGKLLEFVHIPRDEVTNCTFGGDDLKTLYITAGGTLWSVQAITAGELAWPR